ncbi:hypothetical protein GCM10010530_10540 [Kribbella aluminosa]
MPSRATRPCVRRPWGRTTQRTLARERPAPLMPAPLMPAPACARARERRTPLMPAPACARARERRTPPVPAPAPAPAPVSASSGVCLVRVYAPHPDPDPGLVPGQRPAWWCAVRLRGQPALVLLVLLVWVVAMFRAGAAIGWRAVWTGGVGLSGSAPERDRDRAYGVSLVLYLSSCPRTTRDVGLGRIASRSGRAT